MQLKVTRTGVLPKEFLQQIDLELITTKESLKFLAEQTRDHMRQVIKEKTYRPGGEGNLAKSIEAEELPAGQGWGVGNISKMNVTAPYWYLMNYGGLSTIAARGGTIYGSFGPGNAPDGRLVGSNPGAGQEIFYTGGYPQFAMKPKNPIHAKNYIEITANWASTIWRIQKTKV